MTAPVDHEGACEFAKVIVTWRGYSDKEVNLAAAYRDLDARLNAACDALAVVLEDIATRSLDDFDIDTREELLDRIAKTCADAIDAAHRETSNAEQTN